VTTPEPQTAIARAISVRQPWAWAIVHGGKTVENRGRREPWHTAIGEVLGIHAALQADQDDVWTVSGLLAPPLTIADFADVRGALIGTARLTGVHHAAQCLLACSPWAQPDQWHLTLADRRPLPEPLALPGKLGLWTLPVPLAMPTVTP
jgi:hypothetical protein